jgi:hypothetical protein
MTDIGPSGAPQLTKERDLTQRPVGREVQYYYCSDVELDTIKSSGVIFNICLALAVGCLFFALPLLFHIAFIQLDGKNSVSGSDLAGWLFVSVAAILSVVAYICHKGTNALLESVRGRGK